MSNSILSACFLSGFSCLGSDCGDTCCKGWSMQVNPATVGRYRKDAPELVSALEDIVDDNDGHGGRNIADEKSGKSADCERERTIEKIRADSNGNGLFPTRWVMRRNKAGRDYDHCVKYSEGLCSIHSKYGASFLGDACYFFPRITRKVGDKILMSASLSCPEIARLTLLSDNIADISSFYSSTQIERLPEFIKNYELDGVDGEDIIKIHETFLAECDNTDIRPERVLSRMISVAKSLEMLSSDSWAAAVKFYLSSADARLQEMEHVASDPFNLLHALAGLLSAAANDSPRPRLMRAIEDMEKALDVRIDWKLMSIKTGEKSYQRWQNISGKWKNDYEPILEPIMRRWLKMQLSASFYPFSGLGNNPYERIIILAVRFATVKLALASYFYVNPDMDIVDSEKRADRVNSEIIYIIQSISRLLDHLADPEFSLKIYHETGWIKESRIRSLIGDV